ncbi:helix-turn-helix domain-containing protein [Corynebacterium argentoratense]|uniref:AlbA family DNA-binding domain-containing protein n=1 Tax=Corynebacterium argentoratense TaxID=42817 RepID=UPI001F165B90|nr:ATP-binding protein [Corynebacterium argentoratense]MCF1712877.1 ATP-binding protein [Corynebacterium argentoratense]
MNPGSLALLIDQLRAAGNDRHDVEVKSGVGKLPSRMMETVSAFSNMDGGTIILVLSEKDDFRPADGFKVREIHDALATRCSDALTPPARAVIE